MNPISEEKVDIIDENNLVLYQTLKADAHKQGLLHRIILVEVINSKGEYLLVKQASDRQDPNKYVSPVGGHIKSGESEIDALRRETLEESGIKEFTYKYIGRAIYNREVNNRKENHMFILYEIYANENPILNQESVGYKWFSQNELKSSMKNKPEIFGDAWFFAARAFYPELFE
jgi:isopentenyl-diphosphate Delta-isomerase